MTERIVRPDRNYTDRSFRPRTHAFAAVVGDLQDVDPIREPGMLLSMSPVRSAVAWPLLQKQYHRIVVLIVLSGNPAGRRMQNRRMVRSFDRQRPSESGSAFPEFVRSVPGIAESSDFGPARTRPL